MQTKTEDNIIVEFSNPGNFNEPILVRRMMPDNSMETIGHIYQAWNDNDIETLYECRDADGEELIPATEDWIEAENAFIKYAKHYPKRSLLEKSVTSGEVLTWYSDRENEVKGIREHKGRNSRTIGISK